MNSFDAVLRLVGLIITSIILVLILMIAPADTFSNLFKMKWPSSPTQPEDELTTSYAYESLLIQGEGYDAVQRHCTGCHSTRLIIQNRMSRERWEDNITWMQETQGLWDLGPEHESVVDYLATFYAPVESGRRPNLDVDQIEWYMLDPSESD